MTRTAIAIALAGAALTVGALPAQGATWSATPTTSFRVFPDGTMLDRDAQNRTIVRRPDGTIATVPRGWSVVGARQGGDVFAVRTSPLFVRPSGGGDPTQYSSTLPASSIAEYAWIGASGAPAPVVVKPLGRPLDLWPGVTGADRQRLLVNTEFGFGAAPVWTPVDSVQPSFDGSALTNEATGGDGGDNGFPLAPWEPALVASNGRVLGTDGPLASTWNRQVQIFSMPAGGGASLSYRSDARALDNAVEFRGATSTGQALMTISSRIAPAAGEIRLVADPGGPVATCPAGRPPLSRVAEDGSFLDGGCIVPGDQGPRAITMRSGIFGPATWTWAGTPILAAQPLLGGLATGWRATPQGDRAVLLANGREVDATTAMASAGIGPITAVSNVSPAGVWFVSTASGRFLLRKRSVVSGAIATATGAAAAGVPVTVADPSTPAAPTRAATRVVRTDRQGRFSFTTGAAQVRLSVPAPACLASPGGGCATTVAIATGLDGPPPVVGLRGAGVTRLPLASGTAGTQRLAIRSGAISLSVRCLRTTACTGAATLRRPGAKARLATGTIRVAALATGAVRLKLTKAGKKAFRKQARPARITLVAGGRTIVLRVTVRT